MKMNKSFIVAIFFITLFASCNKDNNVPPDNTNTLTSAMARDSLYDIMNEWYYWYNLIPSVNKESYTDPYKLMDAMRYKPLDRWSFVADYDEFMAQMQGTFVGHGFRIGIDGSDNARIAMIFSHSSLSEQGVRRGWIVKKINGTDVAPILLSGNAAAYSTLIGPAEAGITNTFLFQKPDGTEVTISATKSSFTLNSVLLYDTLNLSTGVTGQLVFESFISPSIEELATAFAFFSANGVKDLILDLRYNSGGYLYVAQSLASYIAGNSNQGTDFARLLYNDKHPEQNMSFPFIATQSPLSLQRLIVITTRETASASESVMNGLKPFMNVISIGDTTNGKPTGMDGFEVGKKYFFAPVTFKIVNKNNEGDYFDGIAPEAIVQDDITHDFSEREELCLKAAISYLETGAFSSKGVSTFKRLPQFSEKPEWMKNAFILSK